MAVNSRSRFQQYYVLFHFQLCSANFNGGAENLFLVGHQFTAISYHLIDETTVACLLSGH